MNIYRPRSEQTPTRPRQIRAVDGLLHDFFRAEMPDPWPAPPAFQKEKKQPLLQRSRQWVRARRPLALAAAIILFMAGYETLSFFCPSAIPEIVNRSPNPNIAREPRVVPVRGGGAARVWEQQLPGGGVRIIVEGVEGPKKSGPQP
jgi:hypothetical protein